MAGRAWVRGVCAAHTAPTARARARRVLREMWHFDSALLCHRVFRAAQVPLAPAGLVCVVAGGVCWGDGTCGSWVWRVGEAASAERRGGVLAITTASSDGGPARCVPARRGAPVVRWWQ